MSDSKLVVMKFGGSSVGSAERMQQVAHIVARSRKNMRVVVVVSALRGATDLLVNAAQFAAQKDRKQLSDNLRALRKLPETAVKELNLDPKPQEELQEAIKKHLDHAKKLLESVYELGELTPRGRDFITSFGERMSIHLLTEACRQAGVDAEPIESSKLILTNERFGDAHPLLDESEALTRSHIQAAFKKRQTPIVSGYIGATQQGAITTLGRGGSDYSATILGYCLDANEVWIWTDVDGVMTADPRLVPAARTLETLSYNEAAELSYFGAKVLHPLTMVPAARKHIPILIKNTFQPAARGTLISKQTKANAHPVKAISTMKSLSLITVQGKGLLGVHGIAGKVFSAMAERDITVLFISQASSEFNLSFVVAQSDGEEASRALHQAFRYDLQEKYIETIKTENSLAMIAIVGDGMRGQPGTAGRLFAALGREEINVRAIAQGSSERSISFMVSETDIAAAVGHIHSEFELASRGEV